MHKVAMLIGVIALVFRGEATQNPAIITTTEIIADMTEFRHMILLDTARIDFCAIGDAFDSSGHFRLPPGTVPPRYATLESCRAESYHGFGPVVQRIRSVADTVIVSGFTRRGESGFFEEYRYTPNPLSRSPQSRFKRTYTIGAIVGT
jgi:hypothetical protein